MASLRVVSIVAFAVLLCTCQLRADDSQPYEERISPSEVVPNATPSRHRYETVQPRLGRGYVPYSYPAFDSCPCAQDGCFHPGRYYCGGKAYRKQWFRKWVKTHLGRGSMLDGYPCECISPTAGRPYLKAARLSVPMLPIPDSPKD